MDHDNESRLSPLWRGVQRKPFRRFQRAIAYLARTYDIRDDNTQPRIRISVADINGQPITGSHSLPITAFDDLLLAIQDLTTRRATENETAGWSHEGWADANISRLNKRAAAGKDPDQVRAEARSDYAEAARRTTQPDDIPN
jgi:hypothetical protein